MKNIKVVLHTLNADNKYIQTITGKFYSIAVQTILSNSILSLNDKRKLLLEVAENLTESQA